jgi:protein-glutamine gamma-glutamyltransferase
MLLANIPHYPNRETTIWLLISLILVSIPHITRLPFWVPLVLVSLLALRYFAITKWAKLPSATVQLLLALLVVAGIFIHYKTLMGRDPGVALLVALCGLKFIEMKNKRDALLLCFLGYFLIITNFLYSQSIPTALYMGLVMIITTGTLISLAHSTQILSHKKRFKLASVLLAQGLPIMLLLFVLFPRISGPLWGLPKDAHTGQTGLSDRLELGTISELSLSDEIAFRVEFKDTIPLPADRYWRGPVLWYTDGKNWRSGFQRNIENPPLKVDYLGNPYHYTLTLEPNGKPWLLALDIPTKAPDTIRSRLQHDLQILAQRSIQYRTRYELTSYSYYRIDALTDNSDADDMKRLDFYLRTALQLPDNWHPQTRALGEQWRARYDNPMDIVNQALLYFNQEPFYYTFMSPLMLTDPIDQFMFEMRRGFCEHYAAAFAVLMRSAGIPTRIVTGYLGGRINPVNGMLIVRQRDAHAWNEVWLEGQGWVRVDPTGAVSPERIEQGIDSALSSDFPDLLNPFQDMLLGEWLQQLQDRWDAVNSLWNQWVLGYDAQRQKTIGHWLNLGNIDWRELTVGLVFGVTVILLGLLWWLLRPQYPPYIDPAQVLYLRLCRRLARLGMERAPHEGPLHFAQRVSRAYPERADKIQYATALYIKARYQPHPPPDILPKLRAAIRQFI